MEKVLFIFLLLSVSSYAQVPGYMGKRFIVGYGVNMLPSFSPTIKSYNGGVNLSHIVSLEYGIKNRTAFCLSYQRFRTGMYDLNDIQTPNYTYEYVPAGKGPMPITSNGFGMAFKFFHRGMFAPVGKYRKLGCLLMFNKMTYEKDKFRYYEGTLKYQTLGAGEYSAVNFAVTYELGFQRVISDRFVFDSGLRLGLMPGPLFRTVGDIFLDNGYSRDNTSSLNVRIDTNMRNRIFTHELFSIHVGIGF